MRVAHFPVTNFKSPVGDLEHRTITFSISELEPSITERCTPHYFQLEKSGKARYKNVTPYPRMRIAKCDCTELPLTKLSTSSPLAYRILKNSRHEVTPGPGAKRSHPYQQNVLGGCRG